MIVTQKSRKNRGYRLIYGKNSAVDATALFAICNTYFRL